VIGGISQGAALAVHVLMGSVRRRLGGFVGLSSWMPFASEVRKVAEVNKLTEFYGLTLRVEGYEAVNEESRRNAISTSVFMMHSADDDVVDVTLGRQMKDFMEAMGFKVEWREHADGGHWVNESQGMFDLVAFLKQ
jgi:lysophospholipase-2